MGKGASVVRFYKFSKMLHLDSLVVAKFLMKVDPDRLHAVAQRGWWRSSHEDLVFLFFVFFQEM